MGWGERKGEGWWVDWACMHACGGGGEEGGGCGGGVCGKTVG